MVHLMGLITLLHDHVHTTNTQATTVGGGASGPCNTATNCVFARGDGYFALFATHQGRLGRIVVYHTHARVPPTPLLHALTQKIQNKCSDQPMLLLDVRSVSMRFTTTTTDYDTVAHAAANILDTHNLPPAILVAHSYGTLVATRMQRMYAHMLTGLVLLEPVSLLPVWPSLLNNFVYQVPTIRKALCSWRMLIIWARSIILAKELAVAETFCRKFLWYELILWPQEVPRGSIVALAGRDDLVPSELVAASLGKGVQVLYEAEGTHGECLINLPCADRVAHAVGRMVARMQTKKR